MLTFRLFFIAFDIDMLILLLFAAFIFSCLIISCHYCHCRHYAIYCCRMMRHYADFRFIYPAFDSADATPHAIIIDAAMPRDVFSPDAAAITPDITPAYIICYFFAMPLQTPYPAFIFVAAISSYACPLSMLYFLSAADIFATAPLPLFLIRHYFLSMMLPDYAMLSATPPLPDTPFIHFRMPAMLILLLRFIFSISFSILICLLLRHYFRYYDAAANAVRAAPHARSRLRVIFDARYAIITLYDYF